MVKTSKRSDRGLHIATGEFLPAGRFHMSMPAVFYWPEQAHSFAAIMAAV